jgi:uncharacterized protein (DUF2235 family)
MKKLVVCCDGTGNQVSEDISNVLKFYQACVPDGPCLGSV